MRYFKAFGFSTIYMSIYIFMQMLLGIIGMFITIILFAILGKGMQEDEMINVFEQQILYVIILAAVISLLFYYLGFGNGMSALPLPNGTGIIDHSPNFGMDALENYGTIAYYIGKLDYDQQFILSLFYGLKYPDGTPFITDKEKDRKYERLSDQEIAVLLNYDRKVKNWDSRSIRKLRHSTVKDLDKIFRDKDVALVGDQLE